MPAKDGSKTVRLDPHAYARLERVHEEINRRAREGKDLGGVSGLEFSLAAVHRSLLLKGLEHFEKSFKLPELPEPKDKGKR